MEVVHYSSYTDLESVVRGFQTLTLAFKSWTHEAHLTVAMWYLQRYDPDVALQLLRHAIQHFNLANGVVQTPTRGYHETITVCYVRLIAHFRSTQPVGCTELECTNALLASPLAKRQYLLHHYTRDRLMSWEARSGWVEPDVGELPLPKAG